MGLTGIICRAHHATSQGNRFQVSVTLVHLELLTSTSVEELDFFYQLVKSVDCAATGYDQDTHHHLDISQVQVFPKSGQKKS